MGTWGEKLLLSLALIAPLAFFMGMPFPLALSCLGQYEKNLIPWAWAINGFASVISAILATIVAIHQGFTAVVIIAILLYLLAALSFVNWIIKWRRWLCSKGIRIVS